MQEIFTDWTFVLAGPHQLCAGGILQFIPCGSKYRGEEEQGQAEEGGPQADVASNASKRSWPGMC